MTLAIDQRTDCKTATQDFYPETQRNSENAMRNQLRFRGTLLWATL